MRILKKVLWVLAESLVYSFILVIVAGTLGAGIYYLAQLLGWSLDGQDNFFESPWLMLILEYIPVILGAMLALWIVHSLWRERQWHTTGFVPRDIGKNILLGYGLALLMLTIGFTLLWSMGYLTVRIGDGDWLSILGSFCLFMVQGSVEEIITRSFIIVMVAHYWGVRWAIIISTVFFAVVHGMNPGISLWGMINLHLAGLVFCLMFVVYRNIWLPSAFHAGWNFFQGSLFGFEVSGYSLPSIWRQTIQGPKWITGGDFGFEGSILASILLFIVIIYIGRAYLRQESKIRAYFTAEAVQSI